jgi:hypothetical protein
LLPVGFVRETTVFVTLRRVEEVPTLSIAVTANVRGPMDEVLIGLPLATGAAHDVVPATPSLQA